MSDMTFEDVMQAAQQLSPREQLALIKVLDSGLSQADRIRALFEEWATEPDDTPDEWWDEFDQFLRDNRLNFAPRLMEDDD